MVSTKYFVIPNFCIDDIELKISGSEEERSLMMPLLYIQDDKTKEMITEKAIAVLEAYMKGNPGAHRMKGLDVVKVLMGIMS